MIHPDTILIVAPHPDDETLGCGGTIAVRAQAGCRIVVVVLTDGSNLFRLSPWRIETQPTPAETARLRRAETGRAMDILAGSRHAIHFLDTEDGTLNLHVDTVAVQLAGMIRGLAPTEVFVTSEYEQHRDHVAACAVIRAELAQAASPARLYRYTVILRPDVVPASVPGPAVDIDISAHLPRKRQALSQFASHLTIIARQQPAPFFSSVDPWLQPREHFLVDATSAY